MLIKLLSNQIQEYQDVINEAIDKTIPEYQEELRTKLYEELLLETAQCWISYDKEQFEGVVITKIEEDTAIGGKTCTLISGFAPSGINNGSASVFSGWEAVSKFAISQGCDRIAMYTDNPEVEKYLNMFDKIWATRYYQIRLNKET